MRVCILGPTGSGKGTQAGLLSQHLHIPTISTGEILRQAIESGSDLGQQVKTFVEQGELVLDETMITLIRDRLLQADTAQGWVMDGYPRTAFQAEELDFLLEELGQRLDRAIWLEVSEGQLVNRSLERSRSDDQLEVVQRRIQVFQERTQPILEYYEMKQRLLRINGEQSPTGVSQSIYQGLGV